ncbi:MAG: sulfite exporter TauE/SafE family protein [Bacteroidota bacterium]
MEISVEVGINLVLENMKGCVSWTMFEFISALSPAEWVFFGIAGIITGAINTLAGSGSLITLPIYIFLCGLPAPVANGTNRIGVLIQSFVGIYSFRKSGHLPLQNILWLLIPAIIGAILGALTAVDLDEKQMNLAIGILMVFMLLVLMVKPKRWLREAIGDRSFNKKWYNSLLFLGIGFYGGFIQAGVGIFLLAALVLGARYTLTQANAVKLLCVAVFSIPALFIFFTNGQVEWAFGLAMALFQSIGAYLGVQFAAKVPQSEKWIHRLLILIVVVSASKFLGLWG